MLKPELIRAVAEHSGQTQPAIRTMLASLEAVVIRAIASGQSVMLAGLGKLVISHRGPRVARNLRTGAPVAVAERNVVMLRPSEGLSKAANLGK